MHRILLKVVTSDAAISFGFYFFFYNIYIYKDDFKSFVLFLNLFSLTMVLNYFSLTNLFE